MLNTEYLDNETKTTLYNLLSYFTLLKIIFIVLNSYYNSYHKI